MKKRVQLGWLWQYKWICHWFCDLVVKWFCSVDTKRAQILLVFKLSAAIWPFCVAFSQSENWQVDSMSCCTFYIFLLFWTCRWVSCSDRGLNLYMKIWLPLFWSTWSQARLDRGHNFGPQGLDWQWPWCGGQNYSLGYLALQLTDLKRLSLSIPWIFRILKKPRTG